MKKPRVSDEELAEIIGTSRGGDGEGDVMAVERDLQDARLKIAQLTSAVQWLRSQVIGGMG